MRTSKLIKVFFVIVLTIISIFLISNKAYAKNLDEIESFDITITPNKKDGSLDIVYKITWLVLDSTTEGPLTWVKIGMPNENFSNLAKVEGNIKSINKYGTEYVRIDFNKAYKKGEEAVFSYKFNQKNMYTISGDTVKYTYWPAWFDSIEIKNLRITWDGTGNIENDSTTQDGKNLIWHKSNMKNGETYKINISYPVSYFSSINKSQEAQLNKSLIPSASMLKNGSSNTVTGGTAMTIFMIFSFLVIMFYFMFSSGSRSYYGHSGFYNDRSYSRSYYNSNYHSSCVSSCACASSCASSCACACAGSGRAGCSLKDFYGTNITTEKLKKAFEKNKTENN